MSHVWHDVQQAIRSLKKSPGFLVAAVLVMALGSGANTAIFSVVHAILIRPLPYQEPQHLVFVWHVPPAKSFPGMTRFSVSPANYFDWKTMNHVFENSAIYGYGDLNYTGTDKPERVSGARVESSFFSVLGSRPMIGRTFTADEDQPGRDHVVVLSHAFWKEHFASDRGIVGRNIEFNGEPYTVIGVMPPNFALPRYAQLWRPMAFSAGERAVRGIHDYLVIARLRSGVTLHQANAELTSISNSLAQSYPADDKGWGAIALPLREMVVSRIRPTLMFLLGAVAFVLLIACANVANLMLLRTLHRRREIAIRVALGADRRRLLQQVLSESITVSILGGLVGLIFAKFGIKLIVAFFGSGLSRSTEIGLDAPVLMFTAVVAVLTGAIAGWVPAWQFANANASEALSDSSGRASTDAHGSRTRSILVIAEVALSLMLLVGAGLMMRTLWNLQHTDAGFESHHTLSMVLGFSKGVFTTEAQQAQAMDDILRRVRSTPGVGNAAVIDALPLLGGSQQPIQAEGQPVVQMSDQPEVAVRKISPGYLNTMRIPLLQGRDIAESDSATSAGAILISASMAKRIWPNQDPIGKHLTLTFSPERVREVVGVVGDVKQNGIDATEPTATLYVPIYQADRVKDGEFQSRPYYLVARSSGKPTSIASSVVASIHQVQSSLPVLEVLPMEDLIDETLTSERMNMVLLVSFGGLALALAGVGIYSVLAYAVRRRVREIGIRMALGAQIVDIVQLVLMQGLKPVATGLVIGLALAIVMGRAVKSLVYNVSPFDVVTLGAGALVLLVVAAGATFLPAYRATRVVPVATLREE